MTTTTEPFRDEAAENDAQQQLSTIGTSPANETRENQPYNNAHERDTDTETLPAYSRGSDGLPSYARVRLNDQRRQESLKGFIESKMYYQDTFGGYKGIATGPPNDPAKPFKWIQRKLKGERDVWRKLSDEEKRKWEEDGGDVNYDAGQVATGDMDTSNIV